MSEYEDKRGRLEDVEAVNPRYKGMTLGRMAQLLTRPKTPAAREALDRLQGRTPDPADEAEPAVKTGL